MLKASNKRPAGAVLALICALSGCGQQDEAVPKAGARDFSALSAKAGRWYTTAQVRRGARLFEDNCALCHGANAQGPAQDWRQRLADGSFPPPPLNGTAHTWHHPLPVLLRVIEQGGVPLGGKMPGFAATMDEAQMLAVIAWFQNHWSDEIYRHWQRRGGVG